MSSSYTKCWILSKYAQFRPRKIIQGDGDNTSKSTGDWITKEGTSSIIKLILTAQGHMMIHQDPSTILENVFLPFGSASQGSLKILKNKDSLVFVHSVKAESRVFRVQFQALEDAEAASVMEDCTKYLSKYFAVRSSDNGKKESSSKFCDQTENSNPKNSESISPTMLISKILKNDLEDLPLIYRDLTVHERMDKSTEHFIALCLSDPSFPSYVRKVEKILNKLSESKKVPQSDV